MGDVLKGMDDLTDPPAPGDEAKPAEPAPEPEPEAAAPEPEAEPAADDPPAAPEPAAEPEPEADDPKLAKSLAAIQRQEARAKEAIRAEFSKLEAAKAEWAEQSKELESYKAAVSRAKSDPAGALRALGLGDGDMEHAARQLYYNSPEGQKDPKHKAAAAEQMRNRGTMTEVESLRAEMRSLREEMAADKAKATEAAQLDAYMTKATKAVGDDAPIVRAMLTKNPDDTRAKLHATADRLYAETGEIPEPTETVAALEAERRQHLEDLGIDPALVGKTSETKPKTPVAEEKRPASKTLASNLPSPKTVPDAKRTREEEFADVERALKEGRLE
jgi:hypothetical protein